MRQHALGAAGGFCAAVTASVLQPQPRGCRRSSCAAALTVACGWSRWMAALSRLQVAAAVCGGLGCSTRLGPLAAALARQQMAAAPVPQLWRFGAAGWRRWRSSRRWQRSCSSRGCGTRLGPLDSGSGAAADPFSFEARDGWRMETSVNRRTALC